ncbi:MAG: hypothetical protein PVF73_04280 [Bacteroidales bacterium]
MTVILLMLLSNISFGQDFTTGKNRIISVRVYSGISHSVVRHDYYGPDRYTGELLPFAIELEKLTNTRSWKLYSGLGIGEVKTDYTESDIRNYNIGFDLSWSLFHFRIFNRDSRLFLGPSVYIFTHTRNQETLEVTDHNVILGMLAMGPNLGVSGKIANRLDYSVSGKINMISYGGQNKDSHGFLSPADALYYTYNMLLGWQIKKRTGLSIQYQFAYCNMNKWDEFILGSDSILLGITFKL